MRTLLLTLVVLLALPAAASAYSQQDINRWQSIADQTWGGACAGRLHADVVQSLPNTEGEQFLTLGQAHVNDATTCTYQIVSDLTPYEACVVTVHEVGHLAGYRSPDPARNPDGSVDWAHDGGPTLMSQHPTDVLKYGAYKPCAGFAPPVLSKSAAINWVEGTWVMGSSDCRRESPSRFRCWGHTASGTRVLAIVRMDGDYRVRGKRRGGRSK